MKNQSIIYLFHHIHHKEGKHVVHHCGGKHKEIDSELDYTIEHCSCGKHRINKKEAIGHDFEMNKVFVIFEEKCPDGGWHLESGIINKIL